MEHRNLLGGPPATFLLPNTEADAAITAGEAPEKVAARFPDYSAAWAALAERAFAQGDAVTAYAYARTGYHRGLDQLRRAGWKGHGPVPWEHEPNRGFLRSLHMLGVAADAIGEDDEAERCADFLRDSSPEAADELTAT
jgi:hypothetical protein